MENDKHRFRSLGHQVITEVEWNECSWSNFQNKYYHEWYTMWAEMIQRSNKVEQKQTFNSIQIID